MIKAEIFDQKIKLNTESVASDSVKYLKIKFLLDEIWDDTFKTAVFKNEELDISAAVILEEGNELYLGENTCLIPFEVIKPPCFSVSLNGIKGETVITTLPEYIKVYKSGDISADEPQSYTPSQYEQLVGICNETQKIAQSVREDADNGAFNGKDGKDTFAIKPIISGNIITAHDVSPIEHELKITANLFKVDKVKEQDTDNGKVVVNDDKTLTITQKGDKYIILGKLIDICPSVKGGDDITLSYNVDGLHNSLMLQIGNADYYIEENRICSAGADNNYTASVLLPENISNVYVAYFSDLTTKTLSNIALFKGVVDDITKVTVSRYGKNLFDGDFEVGTILSETGGNSSSSSKKNLRNVDYIPVVPNATYTMTNPIFATNEKIRFYDKNYKFTNIIKPASGECFIAKEGNLIRTGKIPNGCYFMRIEVDCPDEDTALKVQRGELKYQFELGNRATEYEDYVNPQISEVNADGTVTGLTSLSPSMTIMSNNADITLECEYNADTKLYIDNKLAEIKSLI